MRRQIPRGSMWHAPNLRRDFGAFVSPVLHRRVVLARLFQASDHMIKGLGRSVLRMAMSRQLRAWALCVLPMLLVWAQGPWIEVYVLFQSVRRCFEIGLLARSVSSLFCGNYLGH